MQYDDRAAEQGPCVICGARPTIYKIHSKGFCIKHREESLQMAKQVGLKRLKQVEATWSNVEERQKQLDQKSRYHYSLTRRGGNK